MSVHFIKLCLLLVFSHDERRREVGHGFLRHAVLDELEGGRCVRDCEAHLMMHVSERGFCFDMLIVSSLCLSSQRLLRYTLTLQVKSTTTRVCIAGS